MKLKLEITENDITLGERMACHSCPIARAMHRAAFNALHGTEGFNGELVASAKYSKLRITTFRDGHEVDYLAATPEQCLKFMATFDRDQHARELAGMEPPAPFTIEIEVNENRPEPN